MLLVQKSCSISNQNEYKENYIYIINCDLWNIIKNPFNEETDQKPEGNSLSKKLAEDVLKKFLNRETMWKSLDLVL